MKNKYFKNLTLIILILCLLTSCFKSNNPKSFEITGNFDTVFRVILYDKDANIETAKKICEDSLSYLHKLFDAYHDYENITGIHKINSLAGIKKVNVDDDIINILKLGIDIYNQTDKTVNIMMGSVTSLWKNVTVPPSASVLKEASKYTDISNLIINEKEKTVFIKNKNAKIDLGAIAKGYACDILKEKLNYAGYKNAIIWCSSSACIIGDKNGKNYNVAIENPNKIDTIANISVNNTCISTSGDYQRYFEYNNEKYHHIIDPSTLYPSKSGVRLVSVISESAVYCDAYSTALLIMGYENGNLFAQKNNIDAIWFTDENKTLFSGNYKNYLV